MATLELTFELERKSLEVKLGGEDYLLVELDGTMRDRYLTGLASRVKGGGTTATVKNFNGLQGSLLAMSLKKLVDGTQVAVPLGEIQKWPASVVDGLFTAARDLSGLDDEDDEEGND